MGSDSGKFKLDIEQKPSQAKALRLAAVLALAAASGGCSYSIPLGSFLTGGDQTGSIPAAPPPLPMSRADWRHAEAALTVAFDPAESGQFIEWANPMTGGKGGFSRVGPNVLRAGGVKSETCGVFVASMHGAQGERWFQGLACGEKPGDIRVIDAKPWVKPS